MNFDYDFQSHMRLKLNMHNRSSKITVNLRHEKFSIFEEKNMGSWGHLTLNLGKEIDQHFEAAY